MAAAIKRTTLKLGMIPADGIGKEVIPVSSPLRSRMIDEMKCEYELISRPLRELLKLLDLHCPNSNLSLYLLDGRNLIRMEKHFLMRLLGEFPAGILVRSLEACAPHTSLTPLFFVLTLRSFTLSSPSTSATPRFPPHLPRCAAELDSG